MRNSNWHDEKKGLFKTYTIDELIYARKDATEAAKNCELGSMRQNDYLDEALYATEEIVRRGEL